MEWHSTLNCSSEQALFEQFTCGAKIEAIAPRETRTLIFSFELWLLCLSSSEYGFHVSVETLTGVTERSNTYIYTPGRRASEQRVASSAHGQVEGFAIDVAELFLLLADSIGSAAEADEGQRVVGVFFKKKCLLFIPEQLCRLHKCQKKAHWNFRLCKNMSDLKQF